MKKNAFVTALAATCSIGTPPPASKIAKPLKSYIPNPFIEAMMKSASTLRTPQPVKTELVSEHTIRLLPGLSD